MAQTNNLLVSWNFDTVKESDSSGTFEVLDVSNNYYGSGIDFSQSDTSFILKEEIKSYRKVNIDSLDSVDSIQTLEEDDEKISFLHKPSSLKLMIENSMYQIISDEMMNMFSTIKNYSFKFTEPSNAYRVNYPNLDEERYNFFSKIIDKPNLEKHIEFYKWLDSSLSHMINQLLPENSKNEYGLKNTVESHMLERNKYEHKLPLTISHRKYFNNKINSTNFDGGVINNKTLSRSSVTTNNPDKDMVYTTASLISVVNADNDNKIVNLKNKNYKKNYEFIQSSGKNINFRSKTNKTIFKNVFSTTDEYSYKNKDESGEFSVSNESNQKYKILKNKYNETQALSTPYALTRSLDNLFYGKQGDNLETVEGKKYNFIDNKFVQRNVPYTSSNYNFDNNVAYQSIPKDIIQFRRNINLLVNEEIDNNYESSRAIIEPSIQFNIPIKHLIQAKSALETVLIYSPYSCQIDYFSIRNIKAFNNFLQTKLLYNNFPINQEETFLKKILNNESMFNIEIFQKLEVIYPRTDLISLIKIRSKINYEEIEGLTQEESITNTEFQKKFFDRTKINIWSDNSFNNSPLIIRSFWRDSLFKRIRTNGKDNFYNSGEVFDGTGSINALGYPSLKHDSYTKNYYLYHERNMHSAVHPLDCNINYTLSGTWDSSLGETTEAYIGDMPIDYSNGGPIPVISCSGEVYGELSPYGFLNNSYLANPILPDDFYDYNIKIPPKLSFTHHIFYDGFFENNDGETTSSYVINKSYQTPLDCRIKPWYDSYDEYRANIKHKSQDMSIVPEFIVSRHEEVILNQFVELYDIKNAIQTSGKSKQVPDPIYTTINGHERYEEINKEDFIVDLKPFIDKKSNKIKIKLKAIKKLLPYNGFYPVNRTAQVASLFNEEFLNSTGYTNRKFTSNINTQLDLVGDNYFLTQTDHNRSITRTLAVNQPLFSPGILFNTIKAGIAMPWSTFRLQYSNPENDNQWAINYESGNFPYSKNTMGFLDWKFPFETLLNPIFYLDKFSIGFSFFSGAKLQFALPYLDPTNTEYRCFYNQALTKNIGNIEELPSPTEYAFLRKINATELINAMKASPTRGRLYYSAINNFLSETVNFFLKNSELNYFISSNQPVQVQSGSVYTMQLVMASKPEYSMFNKYNGNKDKQFIIPHSLFGPPGLNFDEYDEAKPLNSPESYYPYCPPYMQNITSSVLEEKSEDGIIKQYTASSDYLEFSYTPTESKEVTVSEILNNLVVSYPGDKEDILSYKYRRINLSDSFFYALEYSGSWVIQTKFETPTFEFNGCSTINSSSYYSWYLAGSSW